MSGLLSLNWSCTLSPVLKGLGGLGGGGLQNGRGACEVLPLRKGGGGGKSFTHAEGGGGHKKFGVVFMW